MPEPVQDLDGDARGAVMSVVLATDNYQTIRAVVHHLRGQTVRNQLEIVIVAPAGATLGLDEPELEGFAGVRIVRVESLRPLDAARAAGVRAARAPLIFIGETHTYAHPTWAEVLVGAHAGPWAAVVPGFGNANPRGPLSWSLFLLDYGLWLHGLPAGQAVIVPTHNVAYKREVLLELGSGLDSALTHGDRLAVLFRARAHRTYFEPAARIDHLNVARWGPWATERLHAGLLMGGRRAERWSVLRRLVYFCGSPLIPALLLKRVGKGTLLMYREGRLPPGTLAALVAGSIISTVGEMIGYVRGTPGDADAKMMEMEVHKVQYASPRARLDPVENG
jgi:hypothetical protein